MTITYTLGNNLYLNITNACPCACIFCIREQSNGVGSADSLRLPREPTAQEIKAAIDAHELAENTEEIVFCGFGEPLERAEIIPELCAHIRTKTDKPIRINTNGLVKFLDPNFDIARLACVDKISISLNADDAEEYTRVTRPRFGSDSYQAMLDFAQEIKKYTEVTFSVVANVISPERIANCQHIADKMGIPLFVRNPY